MNAHVSPLNPAGQPRVWQRYSMGQRLLRFALYLLVSYHRMRTGTELRIRVGLIMHSSSLISAATPSYPFQLVSCDAWLLFFRGGHH